MNRSAAVWDFVHELGERTAPTDMGQSFQRLIGCFGFAHFLIGRITPCPAKGDRGQAWLSSTATDWWRFWLSNHYRTDPSTEHFRSDRRPMQWTEMRRRLPYESGRVFEDARSFGIHNGISLSFKLPGSDLAGVTLAAGKGRLHANDVGDVLFASAFLEQRLSQLFHFPAPASRLSRRECECVKWVAAGKTDWEISCILRVSQQTAHQHVRSALKKLNAATRAQAVAIALTTHQISL